MNIEQRMIYFIDKKGISISIIRTAGDISEKLLHSINRRVSVQNFIQYRQDIILKNTTQLKGGDIVEFTSLSKKFIVFAIRPLVDENGIATMFASMREANTLANIYRYKPSYNASGNRTADPVWKTLATDMLCYYEQGAVRTGIEDVGILGDASAKIYFQLDGSAGNKLLEDGNPTELELGDRIEFNGENNKVIDINLIEVPNVYMCSILPDRMQN